MNEVLGTAVFVENITWARGDARKYKVDPPAQYHEVFRERDRLPATTEYVIVSAVVVPFDGPETLIFPATSQPNGRPINYIDLRGSERGVLDHERVLRNGGWLLVSDNPALPLNETGIVDLPPAGWDVIT